MPAGFLFLRWQQGMPLSMVSRRASFGSSMGAPSVGHSDRSDREPGLSDDDDDEDESRSSSSI